MPNDRLAPMPDAAVNALLHDVLVSVRAILGAQFVGMYLDGSLTTGAFDAASDIDFVVVTEDEVSPALFAALHAMHDRFAALPTPWATELEGSYIGRRALRRYDPANARHPNIERGPGERLKWAEHHADWVIHRAVLRERGITLVGPPPHTLIDPISPTALRQAMRSILDSWIVHFLDDPAPLRGRGYQSYLVLTLCRVLYTLHHGAVASKPVAAQWAQHRLDPRWSPLIERAVAARLNSAGAAAEADVRETLLFMRYTLEEAQPWRSNHNP